jgi:hypothetical protein
MTIDLDALAQRIAGELARADIAVRPDATASSTVMAAPRLASSLLTATTEGGPGV